MSEPMTKQRPSIELDDFEREMRDAQYYTHDDPLAELARLVGEQHDPYGDVFAREATPSVHPASQPADPRGQRRAAAHETHDAPLSPRLSGDFAAIEAGLRGTHAPHDGYAQHGTEPTFGAAHLDDAAYAEDDYHHGAYHEPTAYDPAWSQPAAAPRATRRPAYFIAAAVAVGVIGIGTAFALKGHVGTSAREVKTILADESPSKIQPPAEPADKQSAQDVSAMGKGQPATTALASNEEQPVDLLQAARENAAAQARRSTDAASVPVPPSPNQVQTAMGDPAGSVGQSFPVTDISPKRVRVVSVRPDGTILPNDRPQAGAAPAAHSGSSTKAADRSVAKPSTPKVAAKSTSRVTTPKSIDQLAEAVEETATPAAAPAPKAKKPKPQRVASAETGETDATQTAAPEPDAAPAAAGTFSVQLAAPGSEADAKAATSRLSKKFAGPLAGHHLGIHKAESNGKSVYRVRVSSLSRADANGLCEKLKADGGSCFVAKN